MANKLVLTDSLAREWLLVIPEMLSQIKQSSLPIGVRASLEATLIVFEAALSDRLLECQWVRVEQRSELGSELGSEQWKAGCSDGEFFGDIRTITFCPYCGGRIAA